jgi:hypothetical protein
MNPTSGQRGHFSDIDTARALSRGLSPSAAAAQKERASAPPFVAFPERPAPAGPRRSRAPVAPPSAPAPALNLQGLWGEELWTKLLEHTLTQANAKVALVFDRQGLIIAQAGPLSADSGQQWAGRAQIILDQAARFDSGEWQAVSLAVGEGWLCAVRHHTDDGSPDLALAIHGDATAGPIARQALESALRALASSDSG